MNQLEDFAWTTLLLREFKILRWLKVNMLHQLIIPSFEEEGYFNLRPFELVEDLHKRSINALSVNCCVILKIIKR